MPIQPALIVLGFDYGERRIGVAVGQGITGTATPLATLQRRADDADWIAIGALVQTWKPNALVVGLPGAEHESAHAIKTAIASFQRELTARFNLPIYTVDEAYSSVEAYQRLKMRRAQARGKCITKGEIDGMAAAILLEAWMSSGPSSLSDRTTISMNLPVTDLIGAMSKDLRRLVQAGGIERPLMVGIHTGGAWIARRLHELLSIEDPLGMLDISFYRDDFSRIGINPRVKPSDLPLSVDGRHIILVDDVLFTGRTIRAALNEIFDYGRPASVILAVLIERDGRELPIEAKVVGHQLKLESCQHVKLSGPDPLDLKIVDSPAGGVTP